MRRLGFLSIILLSACSKTENTFIVVDEQRRVAEANLMLCGSERPLRRSGNQLAVSADIECEGDGRITLRYASGEKHDCIVGYVTPGALQSFTYRATQEGCA